MHTFEKKKCREFIFVYFVRTIITVSLSRSRTSIQALVACVFFPSSYTFSHSCLKAIWPNRSVCTYRPSLSTYIHCLHQHSLTQPIVAVAIVAFVNGMLEFLWHKTKTIRSYVCFNEPFNRFFLFSLSDWKTHLCLANCLLCQCDMGAMCLIDQGSRHQAHTRTHARNHSAWCAHVPLCL